MYIYCKIRKEPIESSHEELIVEPIYEQMWKIYFNILNIWIYLKCNNPLNVKNLVYAMGLGIVFWKYSDLREAFNKVLCIWREILKVLQKELEDGAKGVGRERGRSEWRGREREVDRGRGMGKGREEGGVF